MTWHWGSCQDGVCRQIVYADSLTPVSSTAYRFSDHPAYVAAFQASLAKVSALNCDILLSPHPSASNMVRRLGGEAPLEDSNACRDYSAKLSKELMHRLAHEHAGGPMSFRITLSCTRAEGERIAQGGDDLFTQYPDPPVIVADEPDPDRPDEWLIHAYFEHRPDDLELKIVQKLGGGTRSSRKAC